MDDGWVRVLHPFNSISVISRRWKGEHERLCAMKCHLGSRRITPPAGFEPATLWTEVGSVNRSATRTLLCLVEDYSTNTVRKFHCLSFYFPIKIFAMRQKLKSIFIVPIVSLWKLLSCHSNQNIHATARKKNHFVEANAMNISAKFQLYPQYSFWGVDFLIFFANMAFKLP